MGRKRTKFDDTSEVYHIRLSHEAMAYLKEIGDTAPDLVRALIDEHRRNRDGRFLDREIEKAREKVMHIKTDLLAAERAVNELEGNRAKMIEAQLGYLQVRQRLVDEYIRNPQFFRGWLETDDRLHLVADAKFNSPREVADFCKAECVKRGYKV